MESLSARIEVLDGDLTKLKVDAIVNAANTTLLGGGGVDGAIHRAAGPGLLEECKRLGGCPVGEAKITRGYQLPARFVIHTVGPVWRGGMYGEEGLLADCYRNSFKRAMENKVTTVAFPAISTGAYGFPVEKASVIAARESFDFLSGNETVTKVLLVCFGSRAFRFFRDAVRDRFGPA